MSEKNPEAKALASVSESHGQSLIDATPDLCWVLAPRSQTVAVQDPAARAAMTCRKDSAGQRLFEVSGFNPDGPVIQGIRNLCILPIWKRPTARMGVTPVQMDSRQSVR